MKKQNKKKKVSDNSDENQAEVIEKLLDDIIKVCPKIRDDKQFIINKLTAPSTNSSTEYILDKIKMSSEDFDQDRFNTFKTNGDSFYVDPFDNIINSSMEIVGVFNRIGNGPKYLFFKTQSKMPDKLTYYK